MNLLRTECVNNPVDMYFVIRRSGVEAIPINKHRHIHLHNDNHKSFSRGTNNNCICACHDDHGINYISIRNMYFCSSTGSHMKQYECTVYRYAMYYCAFWLLSLIPHGPREAIHPIVLMMMREFARIIR